MDMVLIYSNDSKPDKPETENSEKSSPQYKRNKYKGKI